MTRRTFLLSAAAAGALPYAAIDTHIHLFDPHRAGGIPWPPANDPIRSKPTYPSRFREVAGPLGMAGAVVVECSPRIEDNQWVLEVAAKDPVVVGLVGFLDAGRPGFGNHLERFTQNPLFRGIRYGNLWGRDLAQQLGNPQFIRDMRLLAEAGLSLDTANPNLNLLEAMLRLGDRAPNLRMVVDHLPKMAVASGERGRYELVLREFAQRSQTYVKISAVLRKVDGRISHDPEDYRPVLEPIIEAFGEDRVLYGSDWPNSEPLGTYAEVLGIVRSYFAERAPRVREKYFRLNSRAAYRWLDR